MHAKIIKDRPLSQEIDQLKPTKRLDSTQLLRSYIELKVMVPCDTFVVCNEEELSCVPEPDDDPRGS